MVESTASSAVSADFILLLVNICAARSTRIIAVLRPSLWVNFDAPGGEASCQCGQPHHCSLDCSVDGDLTCSYLSIQHGCEHLPNLLQLLVVEFGEVAFEAECDDCPGRHL